MLSQWTTTTNWTDLGSPYLWWTGADDAPILAATVRWGLSSGRLGHGKKVGVVVSDQASDQGALDSYLLPDLKKIGVVPQVVDGRGRTSMRPPVPTRTPRWRSNGSRRRGSNR